MYLQLVLAIITCLGAWLYLRWLRIKRYWVERGIPHIPPVPILGSLTFLKRENFGVWLRRMYNEFQTPYIGMWVCMRPGIIINSPQIARNILVKDFNNFRNRFLRSGSTDPIGNLNLFTVNDPIWTNIRRQLSSVFTGAKLRMLQDYTRTKSKELVQRIHNDRNIKIDLKEMYVDYTTDVIGTSALGVRSEATLTGGGPLRDVTIEFSNYKGYRGLSWFSLCFFPELVDIFRFKFFSNSSTEQLKKIFRAVVAQRESYHKDREAKDLLDILLKIQRENESYSDDLILSQAAIFVLGGYESSATLLAHTTYQLAYLPEVQEKLYQELIEAAERNGSEDFDAEVLSELTYLNCFIKEGFRKFMILSWVDRIADKDYKIDENLTIEAGTAVYINIVGMQFDPKYFPEPYKFDPDRFLPENKDKIEPYSYMPFSEGPRACIGKRFGLMTVQFALASVLLNYKIRPLPNMPHPEDIDNYEKGVLFFTVNTLHVEFVPRK